MKVFLSSTELDLKDPYRMTATMALERLDGQVRGMEMFGARPESATEASLRELEMCELFVGIYAHRYGYIPIGSSISMTEQEYNKAKELKKPMFCYIIEPSYPWPPDMIEEEPGKSKLRAFKERIDNVTRHLQRASRPCYENSRCCRTLSYTWFGGRVFIECKQIAFCGQWHAS